MYVYVPVCVYARVRLTEPSVSWAENSKLALFP